MKKRILCLVVSLTVIFLLCGFQSNSDVVRVGNIYYSSKNVQIYFNDLTHVVDATEPFVTIDDSPLQNVSFEQIGKNTDYPMTILFLVDLKKNNYFLERSRAKEIIERFMDSTKNDLGEGRTRTYFVIPFGDRVEGAYNPEENSQAFSYTAEDSDYFAALSEGISFLAQRRETKIPEYQAIVLITDATTHSEKKISKLNLKNALKEYGIPVYAVVHNDKDNMTKQEHVDLMREITDSSSGTTQRAREYNDGNQKVVDNIVVEMLRSYVLTGQLQQDYIGLKPNPEDTYQLTLRFGTRGSETASAVKKNAKIRGLYNDVMTYAQELTAVAQSLTATAEAQMTATAEAQMTATAEAEMTAIAEAEMTATAQVMLEPSDSWLDGSTTLFGYTVKNKILIAIGAGLVGLVLLAVILFTRGVRSERRDARDDYDWDDEGADIPPTVTDMVPDGIANQLSTVGFETEADRAKGSCNISFENMDRSRVEAPIRESIISGGEKTFGRRTAEGIVGLNGDESISKVHFKLAYLNDTLYIEDMASSNGVVLNGNRIQTRARLKDGDILLIGKTTYRVHVIRSGISTADDKTQLYF